MPEPPINAPLESPGGQPPQDGATPETHFRRASYWGVVWGQLRKNRLAVFGLRCILLLVLLAVYAPLLALNTPFFLYSPDGLEFPLFPLLFNRLFFENSVDIFFNLLMVLSPLYVLAAWAGARWLCRQWRLSLAQWMGGLAAVHLALFFLIAAKAPFGLDNPFYRMRPIVNYEARIAALEAGDQQAIYLFPPLRQNYRATNPMNSLQPPGRAFWLGTDKEGRDVLARVLYGARISLTIGVVAVSIYVAIGIFLGALAGYYGHWVDLLISRLVEIMICFPTFFLILTLAAFIEERSIFHVMIIIGVTGWPSVARLVRAEFLKQKNLEYSQAARALGIPRWRIIFSHILPNALAPVLVTATFGVAAAILVESSLSFLGLGDVTVPSWGALLNAGRVERKLWLILVPGIPIFFVVSIFNLVGEGLRDALDPRLRK